MNEIRVCSTQTNEITRLSSLHWLSIIQRNRNSSSRRRSWVKLDIRIIKHRLLQKVRTSTPSYSHYQAYLRRGIRKKHPAATSVAATRRAFNIKSETRPTKRCRFSCSKISRTSSSNIPSTPKPVHRSLKRTTMPNDKFWAQISQQLLIKIKLHWTENTKSASQTNLCNRTTSNG